MCKLLLASVIALLSVSAMAATCADMSNRELLDSLTATNKTVLDVVTITPIITTDDNPKCYAHLVTQAGELQYNFTVTEIGGKRYVKGLGTKPWVATHYDPIKPSDKQWWDYCMDDANSTACIAGQKRAFGK